MHSHALTCHEVCTYSNSSCLDSFVGAADRKVTDKASLAEIPASDRWGCVDDHLMHPYEGVIRRDNLPVCLDKPSLCTQGASVWPSSGVEMEVCDSRVISFDEFFSSARPANASHQNAPLMDFLKRTEVRRANGRDDSPRLNVLWVRVQQQERHYRRRCCSLYFSFASRRILTWSWGSIVCPLTMNGCESVL